MKKLMIAAASAAMVGGAFAWSGTATYDFVANLTLTAGTPGYSTFESGESLLGIGTDPMEGVTKLWYDDYLLTNNLVKTTISGTSEKTYEWKDGTDSDITNSLTWIQGTSINGQKYPKLAIISADGYIKQGAADLLKRLANTYNKSQSGYWCGEYYWTVETAGQCYRVQSSDSIVDQVVLLGDSCCSTGYLGFRKAGKLAIDFGDAEGCFLNRFGEQTRTAAELLEMYAKISPEVFETATTPLTIKGGYIAGQGSRALVYDTTGAVEAMLPTQISGMIVGYAEAPYCPDCCVYPLPSAVAFQCYSANEAPDTAVFGTFYLNFYNWVR